MSNRDSTGIIAWFAGNHVAANILMLLFVVGGIISVSSMRTETFPSIDPGLINVSVIYPGATPTEVASAITERVEDVLVGIEGIKRITSTASEGYGVITANLEDFVDSDQVYRDIENAVNSLSDFPPVDAERPLVQKVRVTPNVLTLALHGDLSEDEIKQWAETIEDDLRDLDGVALVSLRGVRDYQISVEADESALRQYNVSLETLATLINQTSQDIPAGTIESARGDITLKVQERRYDADAFGNIPVKTLDDGTSLLLRDVASIKDGFDDTQLVSRFNGERAAFIDVRRSESDDTITIANTVKAYLSELKLPDQLSLTLQKDETAVLRDRMNLMMRNALIGFLLVFLILLLFLDLRLAFWTSAAIPISFLGGLMIIHSLGYSLNMISLFALIVVLGIVVDDGIVTGESIFDAQTRHKGKGNATLKGVRNVLAPVTIGVLTTMAAFAPLIFSTGQFGQIVGIIPIVVIPILFVSLMEAYFILPAHLSGNHRWSQGIMASIRDGFDRGLQAFVRQYVTPTVSFAIRFRYACIALFIAIAILTVGFLQSGIIRFLFMPDIEGDEIKITVTMPQGTPFAKTESAFATIEQAIDDVRASIETSKDQPVFESISVSIGATSATNSPGGQVQGQTSSRLGEILVKLVASDFRSLSASRIEAKIRKAIGQLPDVETIEFQSSLIGDQPDIELELSHDQEPILQKAVADLKSALGDIEGSQEIKDSFDKGRIEYIFSLTPEGYSLGLSPQQLGRQLRAAFFGLEAERFQRQGSEVIVYVRYPKSIRDNVDAIDNMRIRLNDGREVPLSSVASYQLSRGYSKIKSVEGQQIVSVTANVDATLITPNDAIERLRTEYLPELEQKYPELSYSFEGESKEQAEDLASLGRNMLIAMMIIYILLGSQLRSYIQPFVIMMAIPFGVVGAILGHMVLGHDLTFISMFGMVALSGVVINDSVVLIDYLNTYRAKGNSLFDSAIAAVSRRFRPILLTTLSTSLGLLPMLLETSIQARFLIPMVISLAMGILFATFVILLLVPCFLLVVEDIKQLPSRLFRRSNHRLTHSE